MKVHEKRLRELLQLPPLTQIGIVVPDLEQTIAYYQETLRIGPFLRLPDFQKLGYDETYYKGEPEKFNSTFAFFRLGPSIYRDFLEAGRHGLHHLGFDVYGDFDERLMAYADMGIGVLMSGRGPKRAFAYLDTEKIGGVILELIDRGGPRC
jgi:catechol 2,3-dioxygenase-like lactoylglutathione lyase family enzyme